MGTNTNTNTNTNTVTNTNTNKNTITNTNTTLLTLRISATGTGGALPLGRQLKQDFQMNICCCYHSFLSIFALAIWDFLSSYLKDKPCKTIENIFVWKVLSNKQQKSFVSHRCWTSNARSRKVLLYDVVFVVAKKYFFKKSKEETSSSPMPDLTSKRVRVGELLAIAASRRTSKFKTVSIANIYTNHIGWLFLFWFQ